MNVAKKSGYPFTMYQIYHTSIHPLYWKGEQMGLHKIKKLLHNKRNGL
jgi:hypothetical protein